MAEGSLIDRIREQVDALSPEEVRAQYAELAASRAKGLEKAKERRLNMTEEQKAQAKERYKTYSATPEAKAAAKAYRENPEVKAKSKEREQARRARNTAILAKAKELGIDKQVDAGAPA